jgi:hypothetical protein
MISETKMHGDRIYPHASTLYHYYGAKKCGL